jgi:molybdate transport system regulatory protein
VRWDGSAYRATTRGIGAGSGALTTLVRSNALLVIPEGTAELPAGSLVEAILLQRRFRVGSRQQAVYRSLSRKRDPLILSLAELTQWRGSGRFRLPEKSCFHPTGRHPEGTRPPCRVETICEHTMTEPLAPHVNLWIERAGQVVLSGWRIALLEAVAETGSISGAAERMEVDYRVAWKKIDEMERGLGVRLVETRVGGRYGGGATLTEAAAEYIRRYRRFSAGIEDEVLQRFAAAFDMPT